MNHRHRLHQKELSFGLLIPDSDDQELFQALDNLASSRRRLLGFLANPLEPLSKTLPTREGIKSKLQTASENASDVLFSAAEVPKETRNEEETESYNVANSNTKIKGNMIGANGKAKRSSTRISIADLADYNYEGQTKAGFDYDEEEDKRVGWEEKGLPGGPGGAGAPSVLGSQGLMGMLGRYSTEHVHKAVEREVAASKETVRGGMDDLLIEAVNESVPRVVELNSKYIEIYERLHTELLKTKNIVDIRAQTVNRYEAFLREGKKDQKVKFGGENTTTTRKVTI